MRAHRKCLIAAAMSILATTVSAQETEVRLGWCAPAIDVSLTPLAVAKEFGWFAEKGIKITVVSLAGSTDCVLAVTTGQIKATYAAPEAVAVMASRGGDIQYYYTGYTRNLFGIAVPANSDVRSMADLRGKRIGVVSMASVGVSVARASAQAAGLNPDTDIKIVVAGSPSQTQALLANGDVAALSQWDMVYDKLTHNGFPMRKLVDPVTENFPSNGYVALRSTIEREPEVLAALARGYAMGVVYAMENPRKALDLHFKHFPQSRSTGLSLEDDIESNMVILATILRLSKLREPNTSWGYNDPAQYQGYIDWLQTRGVLEKNISAKQIVTNDLIKRINDFDPKRASHPK